MNIILIVILIIIIIIIFLYRKYENFNNTNSDSFNQFNFKLPNIFFTKRFISNRFVPPKPKVTNLELININSYFDSNIFTNKLICSSIINQAKCWDNNNCQWIEKVGEKSYCDVGPKFLL
jgi:hypothetical protein